MLLCSSMTPKKIIVPFYPSLFHFSQPTHFTCINLCNSHIPATSLNPHLPYPCCPDEVQTPNTSLTHILSDSLDSCKQSCVSTLTFLFTNTPSSTTMLFTHAVQCWNMIGRLVIVKLCFQESPNIYASTCHGMIISRAQCP